VLGSLDLAYAAPARSDWRRLRFLSGSELV
jgi:hypothetical protein